MLAHISDGLRQALKEKVLFDPETHQRFDLDPQLPRHFAGVPIPNICPLKARNVMFLGSFTACGGGSFKSSKYPI